MTWARAAAVTLTLTGLACEIDGTLGRVHPSGSSSGAATDGGDGSGSGSEGMQDGSAGPEGATSVMSADGGGTGDATGPSDRPAVCHPTPDDSACAECRKMACCAPYEACLAHDSCLCWWDCLATDQGTEQCGTMCGTDGILYAELHACVESSCMDACPP